MRGVLADGSLDVALLAGEDRDLPRGRRDRARLSQAVVSGYWGKVQVRAGLEFDFYLATKHYCVHYLWADLGLKPSAVAQQMGWSLATTTAMLEVYGHGNVGALAEIDAAFRSGRVRHIRDASQTQAGGEGA